ncbi:MAG: hypothetical protein OEN50_17720, partial [Deltaproteobacteria bacterium]|nr:hypothetical protein [Deltaproteobacteria bacterium]
MSPLVGDLGAFTGNEIGQIGGKAASLADLMRHGYPVPRSICITAEAFDRELDLFERAKARTHDEHEQLVAWLDARPAQGALWETIKQAVDLFSAYPLAVRSSATVEDAAEYSFAGQFESFLYVKDWNELVRCIRRCWASVCNRAVVEYCRQADIHPDQLKMAVLVQEMVPADAAGVLFTINPLTGEQHQAVLELFAGTAEELMSGRVNPERQVLDLRGANSIKDSLLPEPAIRDLLELGRRIQLARGVPQDIEWAYSAGKLYLLQARPV